MSDVKKWSVPVVSSQLSRIYTGGLIPQAVLGPHLETNCHDDDQLLVVSWLGGNQELLPHPVGIMDLRLLLHALDQAGEYAYVYQDGPRLVVEGEDSRASIRLVTGHIDQIPNQVSADQMSKFDEKLSSYTVQEIPSSALQEVAQAQKALRSDYLALSVGPEGATFIVGGDTENKAEIDVPELTYDDSYEVRLPAEVFRKVVGLLTDDSTVKVRLTGPDSVIELSQARARHIISDIVPDVN